MPRVKNSQRSQRSQRSQSSQSSQPSQELTQDEIKFATEYLEGILPGKDIQRLPDAGHEYELQTYSFVWYKHRDGRWFPAQVMDPVGDRPTVERVYKEWWGLLGGPDPANPSAKFHVVLCPRAGNAIPDNWYTRKLLQVHKKLPQDDDLVERIMNSFKSNLDMF